MAITMEELKRKARAYDEALGKAKRLYEEGTITESLCHIFPELKESEDEKISKVLIDYFKRYKEQEECGIKTFYGIPTDDILAWLEKQKQDDLTNYKKTLSNYDEAEKEKCDFVGDGFIKCYADFQDFKEGETYWFEYIGDDKYNVRSDNLLGKTYHITPCQLYTIFKKQTWLEKQGNADNIEPKIEPKFHKGEWVVWQDKFYKVNYNGCGYELIDQNGLSTSLEYGTIDENAHLWTISDAKAGDVLYSLDSKQPFIFKHRKPNEQAEVYCGINIYGKFFVENTKDCIITTDKYIPATKEQRDTLFAKMREAGYEWDAEKKELKKIEFQDSAWSEEDYNRITSIKYLLHELDNHNFDDWFDSLKCKPQYIKPSWSEEDERICQCLIEDQEESLDNVSNSKYGHSEIISDLKEMYDERIDWLKTIKERIGWKPSELQIEALESVTENCAYSEYQDCLRELIKQLKKL